MIFPTFYHLGSLVTIPNTPMKGALKSLFPNIRAGGISFEFGRIRMPWVLHGLCTASCFESLRISSLGEIFAIVFLQYVLHFPRGEKFVSLLKQAETPEAQEILEKERARLRALVQQSLADEALIGDEDEGKGKGFSLQVLPEAFHENSITLHGARRRQNYVAHVTAFFLNPTWSDYSISHFGSKALLPKSRKKFAIKCQSTTFQSNSFSWLPKPERPSSRIVYNLKLDTFLSALSHIWE